MSYGIEACALALLRADPDIAVPISRLNHALLREVGPDAGSDLPLHERLRRRPDLFLLLEPRPAPWTAEEWPENTRQQYRDALRAAGLEPETRITPRLPGSNTNGDDALEVILRQLNSSLIDLWDATDDDADLRGQVADAFGMSDLIRHALDNLNLPGTDHPTTPPRDPR